MNIQFIPSGNSAIYSAIHMPSSVLRRDTGIILCYPIGQEYIRCHRLYVNLAEQLSKLGFVVLRFDYLGTGDSYGDFDSFSTLSAIGDIQTAARFMRAEFELEKMVLIGVRLGASLAMMYSETFKVRGLVLWSPVFSGKDYLNEISRDYTRWLKGSFAKDKSSRRNCLVSHGFEYSAALKGDITDVSLSIEKLDDSISVLLIDKAGTQLPGEKTRLVFVESINNEFWIKRAQERDKTIVPRQEMESIIDWIKNF